MTRAAARSRLSQRGLAVAAGLAAAALWAGGSVVSRSVVGTGADAADLTLLRYLGCIPVALLVVMAVPAARPQIPLHRLAVLLLIAGPPYQALLLLGYGHASAGAGALLVTGLMPLMSCCLARLASPGGAGAAQWTGALVASAGVWIFARGLDAAALDGQGLLIFALAAVCWATLGHLIRLWAVPPLQLTVALALWSPLFLPFWLFAGTAQIASLPLQVVALQIGYHGVLVAFVATLLFFVAVRDVGPESAGTLQAATPGLAVLIGAAVLVEPLGTAQMMGAMATTLGLVLAVDGDGLFRRWRSLGTTSRDGAPADRAAVPAE